MNESPHYSYHLPSTLESRLNLSGHEDNNMDVDDLDQPLQAGFESLLFQNYKVQNTEHNGYDPDIENIEKTIRLSVTRIKRRIIHIIAFRQMQLQNNLVSISGTFNKYNTLPKAKHPHISCRNMLKLIRWCRYFDRTVIPNVEEHILICEPNDLLCIPRPSRQMLKESQEQKRCYICKTAEYTVAEDQIQFCQLCLYRKYKFLYGSMLECHVCKEQLFQDNFEWWEGDHWCKKCLWKHGFDTGLVRYSYNKIVEIE